MSSTEVILPGRLHRETEFVGGLHGACGPNAASMAERWADQSQLSTLDVYHRMRAAGLCDANGVTTPSKIVQDARNAGYTVATLNYQEPMPVVAWRPFFDRHVAQRAFVIEVANGQALHDEISGKGENASNLHYHFVTVVGHFDGGISLVMPGKKLPAGWWVCDGDNFAGGDVLQYYAEATLAAARPVFAMAVYPRVSMGGTHVIPNGWTDDGTTLTGPNKVGVVKGFRQHIIGQAWDAEDWPLLPEYTSASIEPGNPGIGAGSRQDFRKGSLGYTEKMGVYRIWIGQDYEAQQQSIAQLRTQVATLEAELSKGDKADAALRALKDALASVA